MKVTVGTFNLNNLLSRFKFAEVIEKIQTGGPTGGLTIRYEFTDSKQLSDSNVFWETGQSQGN